MRMISTDDGRKRVLFAGNPVTGGSTRRSTFEPK
jgi:hypothetical protein